MLDRIKRTKLYREKLVDTKLVAFLKRVKHFLSRCKAKIMSKIHTQVRYPRMLPLWEQYFTGPVGTVDGNASQGNTEGLDPVDVIIPIYNGYDYLVRLFEDLPRAGMPCRFLLVDDKSPDERVHRLEEQFVAEHDNAVLLANEENLGFVRSVNRGLSVATGHVALVNTDTELPEGWLYRLMRPILEDNRIASTTPYTNSATIYSFPNFCYNNPIYRNLSVEELDRFFGVVRPRLAQAPTGVGFCMGMNRAAIDAVGVLDAEKYGRGYGEENDWCQRAIKKGFKNVQVENLFVYHKHGGSFISEEKQALIASHEVILKADYPNYDADVIRFIQKDVNKVLRELLEITIDTHAMHSVLYVNHCLGGGATKYLNEKKELFLREGACVTVLAFDTKVPVWTFTFENERGSRTYECWSMEEVRKVCDYLKFDEIYINELVSFAHLWDMQKLITEIAGMNENCKLIMLMHDYFAICPGINLTNEDLVYCGMPETTICEKCYTRKGFPVGYDCPTRGEWIGRWGAFLRSCQEVRCFSEDTRKRMQAAFGDSLALTLVPHEVKYCYPIHKETKITDTLNIGLLGVLTVHKGGAIVKKLAAEIEKQGVPVTITLIGRTEELDMKGVPNFRETGAYAYQELPKLIYENDIDLFLIPSIWPETFSYTTEEIMQMGLPVACLDLGAPAERVRRYAKGLVLAGQPGKAVTDIDAADCLRQLMAFGQRDGICGSRITDKEILYLAEYISFSSRYRLEHLREELLYQGIAGKLVETSDIPTDPDWNRLAAIVIYRCRDIDGLPAFIEKAREHGVPLLYDIDDYIFEYDAIRDLPFMKDEEYRDFETYSGDMRRCMEKMDAFLVSTNHMKQVTEAAFPGRKVYVNRNVASAEMLMLSTLAYYNKPMHPDQFILGYYSGSNTHNRDFELISDVLLAFMKKHSDVYLKLVGCLEPGEKFDCVKEQIIREGFMDWRKLPESIAAIDVNLMPLENTLFHRCKSENKWMEAGLVGVATIGSANAEINAVTHNGEDIVLCDTMAEWEQGLEKLYSDKAFHDTIAENAHQYVITNKITLKKDRELLTFCKGE